MELRLNGLTLPISHLGPDFLVLARPTDHPPADAEITLTIDGHPSRWPIRLPHGLSVSARRTTISRVM
jgi:hypothetical protein